MSRFNASSWNIYRSDRGTNVPPKTPALQTDDLKVIIYDLQKKLDDTIGVFTMYVAYEAHGRHIFFNEWLRVPRIQIGVNEGTNSLIFDFGFGETSNPQAKKVQWDDLDQERFKERHQLSISKASYKTEKWMKNPASNGRFRFLFPRVLEVGLFNWGFEISAGKTIMLGMVARGNFPYILLDPKDNKTPIPIVPIDLYNGEIYNEKSLRDYLKLSWLGMSFRTKKHNKNSVLKKYWFHEGYRAEDDIEVNVNDIGQTFREIEV